MFTFNSSFIGYSPIYQNSDFHGKSDSQKKFMKSLNTEGPDWEYAKSTFNYIRNSYGHRSKELTEINCDNYILFTGCSLTEGIGLPVENRYSNILSNLLQCDMYNLALGGTGNDIIFYNLATWFSLVKAKPKLVVIQWTDDTRFMTLSDNMIAGHGLWDDKCNTFITAGDMLGYFDSKTMMFKQMVKNTIDVPIIEMPWINSDRIQNQHSFKIKKSDIIVDVARDLSHPGTKSNKNLANILFDHIKEFY